MSARERVKRYRMEGGASDLVRIEVLVPPSDREHVIGLAKKLREAYRARRDADDAAIQAAIDLALARYGVRILDNIDLGNLHSARERARVVARGLMDRGDARAFVMGRRMLGLVQEVR